jgi:hypothetical protein
MRDGKFEQSTDGKCPEGFKSTMFRCEGSLSWCEPKDDTDIAVNGGSMNYKKEGSSSRNSKDKIKTEESESSSVEKKN